MVRKFRAMAALYDALAEFIAANDAGAEQAARDMATGLRHQAELVEKLEAEHLAVEVPPASAPMSK